MLLRGGGEPGLLREDDLSNIIKLSKKYFNKTILITNGVFLSYKEEKEIERKLINLNNDGLNVLSISRHHYDKEINAKIMGIDSKSENIFRVIKELNIEIKTRLICVLQKTGINNAEEIEKYIDYALFNNVKEICFKELYVSSIKESLYSNKRENDFSKTNQVSLSIVVDYCNKNGYKKIDELPWGSPIFFNKKNKFKIAAYTEPSVGWERVNGVARSWNIMSSGECYVSLEDNKSKILDKI